MKLSLFGLIRNEKPWIAAHLLSLIDYVHEFVFFDGNSTDGTLEVLHQFHTKHPLGHKVRVFNNKDPKNLQDDYVACMNEAIGHCTGDYAAFLHADMQVLNPERICAIKTDAVALTVNMRSFAGEPGGKLYEFTEGRTHTWKPIHRNALGLHYSGHYGAANEDLYHSAITGDEHILYKNAQNYPYKVEDSGLNILHFSDVRPYQRRINRMITCLQNQNPTLTREQAYDLAKQHPRVSLDSGSGRFGKFLLKPAEYPEIFSKADAWLEGSCQPTS